MENKDLKKQPPAFPTKKAPISFSESSQQDPGQRSSEPLGRSGEATDRTDEISIKEIRLKLKEWYKYLWSKWLIIFIAALVGGVIGWTYAWMKKPVYTATTTFVLETADGVGSGLSRYAGIASMIGIDAGGGGGIFQGDNILELYKSRTMIQKTLLSEIDTGAELLIDRYINFNKLRDSWNENVELKNIQFRLKPGQLFSRRQDSILGGIVKRINKSYLTVSKPDKKLSIIQVDVRAADEIFAKSFNEQIVENVNDFYVQTKTKKALDNVAILQQKTDSVRAAMNSAIYTSAVVADATPNLNPTRQVQRVAPMQRSQFATETNKAILSELMKNLEMSKMALRQETPLIQVVDQPIFPLEKSAIGKLTSGFLAAIFVAFLISLLLLFRKP